MSKTEATALRAITTYARNNLGPNLKILDLHYDKARGAWVASAIGKVGNFEVTARDEGSTFEVSHTQHNARIDRGAAARAHSHVANESAAAFLMRGVVFAAIAAALGLGYVVGKPHVERILAQAQEASNPKPSGNSGLGAALGGKSELGDTLGGNSALLESAEKLSKNKKANDAMNRFIKQNAGDAADKLETLQKLNSTGQ